MRKYSTEWLSINRMSHVTHAASLRGGVFPDAEPVAGGSRRLAYVTPNTIMIVASFTIPPLPDPAAP